MRFGSALAMLAMLSTSVGVLAANGQDSHLAYRAFDTLVSGCTMRPEWQPDGSLVFSAEEAGKTVWMRVDPATARIAPMAAAPAGVAQTRVFPREVWGVMIDFPEIASPAGNGYALLRDQNLWVRGADGGERRLTEDGKGQVAWDIETMTASPWTPDGMRLFALRYDRGHVPKMPQIVYGDLEDKANLFNHQRAGGPIDRASAFVVPVKGGAPIAIDLGDTENVYLNLLGWTPDSKAVLIARTNRVFNKVDIVSISAATGRATLLFSETGQSFVRIMHEAIFENELGFTMLGDGAGFLWESERDGWNRLYHYDQSGRLIGQVSGDVKPVHQVVRTAPDGLVYFLAGGDEVRPYDRHLYRVALKRGTPQRLTDGPGRHDIAFAPDGKSFLDSFSTPAVAPRHIVRSADGRQRLSLPESDLSRLQAIGWTAPEEVKVKAADGTTDLHGLLYKPSRFDPARKYPLVEFVYGGPQTTYAPRTFCRGSQPFKTSPSALAEKGFLVLILDGRGTPGRSKAFHDAAAGDWASHVVADHAGAIRQLAKAKSYIDAERVGVFGYSWGGYFAFRFLVDAPDVYRAGITIVPGFDPYASFLYEPYLGLPETNPKAFEAANVFRLASKLSHPYMLVGATLDWATLGDVMRMSRALVAEGKMFEQLILPDQDHAILGQSAIYLSDRVEDFFERHLRSIGSRRTENDDFNSSQK